jgi:hypothetical protein
MKLNFQFFGFEMKKINFRSNVKTIHMRVFDFDEVHFK